MLVISRHTGESITLELPDGRAIDIAVLRNQRGVVRLGIAAPEDVLILREELKFKRKEQTNGTAD